MKQSHAAWIKVLACCFIVVAVACLTFSIILANVDGENGTDGKDGLTITDVVKTTDSNVDTYTVYYSDGSTYTFTVTNAGKGDEGVGISTISKTSTSGTVDTYTIYLTDGSEYTFDVTNGAAGAAGSDGTTIAGITTNYATDGTTIVSYTITYSDGTTYTLTNGEDGTDGTSVTITDITAGTDTSGSYQLITFSDGKEIKVYDGVDGTNGVTITGITTGTDSSGNATHTINFSDGSSFVVTDGADGTNGSDGNGISNVEKTDTNGLVDTYTITFTNGGNATFTVTNGEKGDTGATGNGIQSIALDTQNSTDIQSIYIITYTNGDTDSFTVTNGTSISSISKTAKNGLVDTYTITLTDGSTSTFEVTNARSITSVDLTSSNGLTDIYTITYNDGTTSTFTVTNSVTWYTGTDSKKDEVASPVDGDYYLATDTGTIYIYASNGWAKSIETILGEDGTDGTIWYTGSGVPSSAYKTDSNSLTTTDLTAAKSGDFYYDQTACSLYTYVNNDWSLLSSITGATGADGTGISDVTAEDYSGSDGTGKTITITLTDGLSESFTIINGEKGDTGETGNGIAEITSEPSADGLYTTYTIKYTDNTKSDYVFTVNNGVGIKSVEAENNESTKTITFTYKLTDGSEETASVTYTPYIIGISVDQTDATKLIFEYSDGTTSELADVVNVASVKSIVFCGGDLYITSTDDSANQSSVLIGTDSVSYQYKLDIFCENHSWDGGVTTDATCEDDGYVTYTCSACNSTYTTPIAATGHSYGDAVWSWETDYSAATATFTCSNCGVEKTVHAIVTSEVTTEATCNTDGTKTYTASLYFENTLYKTTTTQSIPATGVHSYVATWAWEENYSSVTATFTCEECSTAETVTATTSAAAAIADEPYGVITSEIVVAATCVTTGITRYTATVYFNGETYTTTETVSVEAAGHDYTSLLTDYETDHYHTVYCSYCGYITEEHSYKNGTVCDVCGVASDIIFKLSSDGTYYTVSDGGNTSGVVIIPSVYNGLPVTAIDECAFYDNDNLIEVVIPGSIITIENEAFEDCTNLEKITICNGVVNINDYAFEYCESITTITIPDSVTYMGEEVFYACYSLKSAVLGEGLTQVPTYCFEECYSLKELTFGSNVTELGDYVFYDCYSLESLVIPDSVTSVGEELFYGCYGLKSVTLGDGLTAISTWMFDECYALESITIGANIQSIGDYAFYGCTSLAAVNVDSDSEYFTSIDGVVYSKDKSTLIMYPCAKTGDTFEVPSTVTAIAQTAFSSCIYLTTVKIGTSVTQIGSSAFNDCQALESIYYSGTASLWANITFADSYSNGLQYADSLYIDGSLATQIFLHDISSVNAYAFAYCKTLTKVTFQDNNVTSIGDYAFYYCTALTSITIPDSVQTIGSSAFGYCKSLVDAIISEDSKLTTISNNAFYYCTVLSSITIPSGVTSIGNNAFNCCYNLATVYNLASSYITITAGSYTETYDAKDDSGKTITSSGYTGYYATEVLESGSSAATAIVTSNDYIFTIADDTCYLTAYVGSDTEITLPDISSEGIEYESVSCYEYEIGEYAFYGKSIKSVIIPDCVTAIGKYAFSSCGSLKSITIGSDVKTIGNYAFAYCYYLTEINYNATSASDLSSSNYVFRSVGTSSTGITVTIGDSVTTIPAYLFCPYTSTSTSYAPKITKLIIGESVNDIRYYAFAYNIYLTEIYYNAESVSYLGRYINSAGNNTNANTGNWVFNYAGYNSGSITVTVGSNVESLPAYLFCPYLYGSNTAYATGINQAPRITKVVFESTSSVTSLGSYAFCYCNTLTSIELPASLESIGYGAFAFTSISSFSVASGSSYFATDSDGNLYNIEDNSNGEYLYLYAAGKTATTYEVPYTVLYIASGAFFGNIYLENITFASGSSLTSIPNYAFQNCVSLTSIAIPDSVTSIGTYAFAYCASLESVTLSSGLKTIGNYAFHCCEALTSITIPNTVTSIGQYAFYDCLALSSVTFEDTSTVTSINYRAFCACKSLTTIIIPDSVTSLGTEIFYNCTALESVTIGSGITSIPSGTFYGCTSLTSVIIGSGITSISGNAFYNCTSLASFTVDDDNTAYSAQDGVLYNKDKTTLIRYPIAKDGASFTIPDDVTAIYSYAFQGCTNLTSVVIPATVTSIGTYAFSGCTSLASVTFMATSQLESIGDYAFYQCYSLADITIPSSVTSIGNYAFAYCYSLTTITIPSSVTSIGSYAFTYCYSLASLTIGSNVTSIGSGAFQYCNNLKEVYNLSELEIAVGETSNGYAGYYATNIYTDTETDSAIFKQGDYYFRKSGSSYYLVSYAGTDTSITLPELLIGSVSTNYALDSYAFYNRKTLTSVTISDYVTSIGNYAFYGCTALASITISDSVKSIGYYAFYGCTALASVTISDSVTSIGYYAFYGCTALANLTIGSSVTSIGYWAFSGCTALESVVIPDSVTTINYRAFSGCTALESVTIGSGVTKIYYYAFYDCTALTTINYNAVSAELVANGSYYNVFCNAGKNGSGITLNIGEDVQTIPDRLFYNYNSTAYAANIVAINFAADGALTKIGAYAFYYVTALTSVVIPETVTTIGNSAFAYCNGLESVTIPASITEFGSYSFSYCYALKNLTLTEGLTMIGNNAFSNCYALTSITIPASVTSMSGSFNGCYKLIEVYNLSEISIVPGSTNNSYSAGYLPNYAKVVYTSLDGESSFVTNGDYLFYSDGDTYYLMAYQGADTDLTLPESFGGSVLDYEIYSYAFYRNTTITSIVIPDCVTAIGNYAFYNCTSLTSVTFGSGITSIGNYAFYGCSSIDNITIPSGVTSLGYNVFYNCTSLTSIVIPDSLTSISNYAFYGCSSLTSVTLGSGVTSIGSNAFYNCTSLTSIDIPDTVTTINGSAFYGCKALSSITLGSGITSIGYNAFYNTAYYINPDNWTDSVLYIGNYLIKANTSITGSYTIASGTVLIASNAFYQCYYLTDITIADSVIYINSSAFGQCTALTSVVIPDNVTTIGSSAFYYCTSLVSLTIGSSVTSIGSNAFQRCTALTSVVIPNSVTEINTNAFNYCTSLESVSIGSGVSYIGYGAFSECSALTDVTFVKVTGWQYAATTSATEKESISSSALLNHATAAEYLTTTYYFMYWYRNV